MTHYPNALVTHTGSKKPHHKPTKLTTTSYNREDVMRIVRKVQAVMPAMWSQEHHRVYGPSAEVLRGLLTHCQTVNIMFSFDNRWENKGVNDISPWHDFFKHSRVIFSPKFGGVNQEMQIHDLGDGDLAVVTDGLYLSNDAAVYGGCGINVPTLCSNLILWDHFNMGRADDRGIVESASEAYLAGALDENDMPLFGEICRYRLSKNIADHDKLYNKIIKRTDSEKWLDAIDA